MNQPATRRFPMLLAVALTCVACALSGQVAPADPPTDDEALLTQPTEVPGSWKLLEQDKPDLDKIVAAPATRRPVYGLYCWAGEYIQYHDFIRKVGFTNMRLSGPMNDACMKLYVADDVEVMATLTARVHQSFTGKQRDWRNRMDYDSDEAFIADYLKGVDLFLTRWGPGGTFFDDHPDLPQRPIRYVEIWNEPNFWYLDARKWEPAANEAERLATEARREKLYAKLLPATHAHIKKEWPKVQVVGFAAGGASHADVRFIENVHANNPAVAGSYDILSTHPYMRPVPPEAHFIKPWGRYSMANSLAEIRQTMRKHQVADRPIW